MTHFLDIDIEGYGSIVNPTNFVLDLGNTLSVIRGEVGHGKTTIPSSLCWALFGKSLKDKSTIETWPERRGDNYRGTKVRVNWKSDKHTYSVIRCKNFRSKITVGNKLKLNGANNLFLLVDGELYIDPNIKGKGKGNTQENIEKILGYSFELFKNSIVFGQKMKRIIEETGPNKKKVFEEAFEVGFIDEAKSNVTVDKEKLIKALHDFETEEDKLMDKINNKQELLESAEKDEKNFEKRKAERLGDLNQSLKETRRDFKLFDFSKDVPDNIEKLQKDLHKAINTLNDIEGQNEEVNSRQKKLKEIIKDLSKHEKIINKKPKLCPACNEPLSDKGYKNMVASAQAAFDILVKEKLKHEKYLRNHIKKDTKDLEKRLATLRENITLHNQKRNSFVKDKQRAHELEKRMIKLRDKIDNLKSEKIKIKSKKLKKQIKKLEKQYKAGKETGNKLREEIDLQNWLINDPLSNNGLKAYMFDNLLNQVNDRLDDYAKILGFQVEFGIDLDSHRKDFYQAIMIDDIVIPYEDLSGGQKQLVDTSVAFAIHDVISEIRPTNLMFLDEPFESLGVNEIEIVAELVQEKAKNKSLFLITHHQSFNPININEINVYVDENKQTVIE